MPSPVLTFLKYLFLVVLYLFFLRVVRAVWTELREPAPGSATPPPPAAVPTGRREKRAARAATSFNSLAVIEPPDRAGERFSLGQELTLGRSSGCGVTIGGDTFVSQRHARVFRRDDGIWVEDLGSTNGTFVDDHRIAAAVPLRAGNRLKVGRTVLELAP